MVFLKNSSRDLQSEVILHIVADDNKLSRFLILYHRIFNIVTIKTT